MPTIADQANEVKAAAASQLPPEVVAAFASDQAALAAGGIPVGAVSVGDKLAPFALPDATGKTRPLDELTAQGPAVIVFYRGGWCPYCNVTLRTYERDLLPHLGGRSARLVASPPRLRTPRSPHRRRRS
jgi:AhpC/TSA family